MTEHRIIDGEVPANDLRCARCERPAVVDGIWYTQRGLSYCPECYIDLMDEDD